MIIGMIRRLLTGGQKQIDDWPFEDSPKTAVLMTRDILEGTTPILYAPTMPTTAVGSSFLAALSILMRRVWWDLEGCVIAIPLCAR